jgi:pyruvate dehydrogenase E2 component (dihydrolipoamide acetyltransferase)
VGYPIIMPSLGMFTAEGSLSAWLKPHGAQAAAGEPIVLVETEKTTQEIVAPADGIVHHVAEVGANLPVQALIGYILGEGEAPPIESDAPASGSPVASSAESDSRVETLADSSAAERRGERAPASPIARRLAAEYGIDLSTVRGTGPGGRIVEADIRAMRTRAAASVGAEPSALTTAGLIVRQRIPLVGTRRTIAERLRSSLSTTASVTLSRETDATQLVSARSALSAEPGLSVPYDALFVRLFALALSQRRELNAVVEGDAILVLEDINVGFAVSVESGLVVPVVQAADRRPFLELVSGMRELSERAAANRLAPEDVRGGTATITNLGAHGVDVFTPVLNPPQSVILGIGRITKRAVVIDEHLEMRSTCTLSLTFDHRVVDGVPAAQLLGVVAGLMNDDRLVELLESGASAS